MKHLYTYISPNNNFNKISEGQAKIHIDNLQILGVSPSDIVLVTNFPYEYNGVKAVVLGDHVLYKRYPRASKTTALFELFRLGMIAGNYWVKDMDLYQVRPVTEEEIGLDEHEVGFTTYGYLIDGKERWNTGSFFINGKSENVIKAIYGGMFYHNTEEENSFIKLMEERNGQIWNIKVRKLDRVYNVGYRGVEYDIDAIKSPAALHFPLKYLDRMKPYMTEGLLKLFDTHLS